MQVTARPAGWLPQPIVRSGGSFRREDGFEYGSPIQGTQNSSTALAPASSRSPPRPDVQRPRIKTCFIS